MSGWTPDRVRRAGESADSGSMTELADLVETIFTDDRVAGVLSTRTHGLLGLPVEFKGGSPQARTVLAGKGEIPGEWQHMHDESELVKLLKWGLTCGVGLAQRIPLPRVSGQMQRYTLQTWSPRWLQFYHMPVNGAHWRVTTAKGQESVVPGDGQWILFQPYGGRRPWAEGLWRALVIPWLLKQYSREDRANYSEALGQPVGVGTVKEGSTEKQRNRYLSQIRALGKQGRLVLPEGWDYKLVEASGKSFENFEKQILDSNESITIVLAGQLVTTEGTPGFSSGNIHDSIKQDLIRFDSQRLSNCLFNQSLELWALSNYGSRSKAPFPEWLTQKPADTTELAVGFSAVGDAITKLDTALKTHGFKVDAKKLADQFNVPLLNAPVEKVAAPEDKGISG